MSSDPQGSRPMRGLSTELLEQVVEGILTTQTLGNFARTCSTVNSIVKQRPLQLYVTDIRFQRLRRSDPRVKRDYHPTLPSLIHAIFHDDFDKFKVVFKMYRKSLSRNLLEKWPKDESGDRILPTPISASIVADRFDIFWYLLTSTRMLSSEDWKAYWEHPFLDRAFAKMKEKNIFFHVYVYNPDGSLFRLTYDSE
ncbi:hypothetical protein F5Y03DRAFT_405746 [Xylaria venustula]|nr:hypothetical protein F5Y03DRAFT_405746 [Xylaria venustula]